VLSIAVPRPLPHDDPERHALTLDQFGGMEKLKRPAVCDIGFNRIAVLEAD
jgi:hypothetical protein